MRFRAVSVSETRSWSTATPQTSARARSSPVSALLSITLRVYPAALGAPAARLRVEQPQLEHMRGVESVDSEGRPCCGHCRARRHQTDQLGADYLRPALRGLLLHASDDLV